MIILRTDIDGSQHIKMDGLVKYLHNNDLYVDVFVKPESKYYKYPSDIKSVLLGFDVGLHVISRNIRTNINEKEKLEQKLELPVSAYTVHGSDLYYSMKRSEHENLLNLFDYSCTNHIPSNDVCWHVNGHYIFFCFLADYDIKYNRSKAGDVIKAGTDRDVVLTVHPSNWHFYEKHFRSIIKKIDVVSMSDWLKVYKDYVPTKSIDDLMYMISLGKKDSDSIVENAKRKGLL